MTDVDEHLGNMRQHLDITLPQGVPQAVLMQRPNSHAFIERRFSVESPVKIGRAVAKCKASVENAVFDCKVLSRNHATLWYDYGKFYLQDTRSSNGTFVNSARLSNANEESLPKEVFSGDVVQFGVDVIENSRRVTHGCIVATLKLYLPDGMEARPASNEDQNALQGSENYVNMNVSSHSLANISTHNLYQLAQCLKDAMEREEVLRNKLTVLQNTLMSAQAAAESGWKSFVEEDRLLSRIESLQSKLQSVLVTTVSKPEEKAVTLLRDELLKLHDEREQFEVTAKEAIQRANEKTLLSASRVSELEIALSSASDDSKQARLSVENYSEQMSQLTEEHDKALEELKEMVSKWKVAEEKIATITEELDQEKNKFEERIAEWHHKEMQYKALEQELQDVNTSLREKLQSVSIELEEKNNKIEEPFPAEEESEDAGSLLMQLAEAQKELGAAKARIHELTQAVVNHNEIPGKCDEVLLTNGDVKSDKAEVDFSRDVPLPESVNASHLKSEVELLRELLAEARASKEENVQKTSSLLAEVEALRLKAKDAKCEHDQTIQELHTSQALIEEKNLTVESLRGQLSTLANQLQIARDDVSSLKESIAIAEKVSEARAVEITELKLLGQRQQHVVNGSDTLATVKESSSCDKLSSAECEAIRRERDDLTVKLKKVERELASVKKSASDNPTPSHFDANVQHSIITGDISGTSLSSSFDMSEISVRLKEREEKLEETSFQLETVRNELEECRKSKEEIGERLSSVKEDFELVSYQNKIATMCAMIPLFALLVAILMAFYPAVSTVTGTSDL